MELIQEAVNDGARLKEAWKLIGLGIRTYERWSIQSGGEDQRAGHKTEPPNELTKTERKKLLEVVNNSEFRDLPPSQIVPRLAERREYYASEATIYRVLPEEKQLAHRGRTKEPQERIPVVRIATQPNPTRSGVGTLPTCETCCYVAIPVTRWRGRRCISADLSTVD